MLNGFIFKELVATRRILGKGGAGGAVVCAMAWLAFAQPKPAVPAKPKTAAVVPIAAKSQAPVGTAATMPLAAQQTLLHQYCVGCHNQKLRSGGFSLDPNDLAKPWE